jgi:3-dehydroquinate synthase
MNTVRVNLGERSYEIAITAGNLDGLGSFAGSRAPVSHNPPASSLAFLVTDEHVSEHAGLAERALAAAGFRVSRTVLPPGEECKSLTQASRLFDLLVEAQADRSTLVVAVGGGVIGDLAGFVAATYARGLPWLVVPTTLLAMVDSSVGGKVGVNHPRAKNLIGAFHQPAGVWIDTGTLATLPEREYRSGLAEVVKYGVILDADFFAWLEANAEAILRRDPAVLSYLVARCCQLKAGVVEQDEREQTGLRTILNYGHTFAHAFETVAGYGAWLHGEAVAAGMICASRLACRRGLIEENTSERQRQLLERFGLPTQPGSWPAGSLLAVMASDKKNLNGRLRFILPRRIGAVALFDDIPVEDVREVLAG